MGLFKNTERIVKVDDFYYFQNSYATNDCVVFVSVFKWITIKKL